MAESNTPERLRNLQSRLRQYPAALRDEIEDLLARIRGVAEEGWFGGRTVPAVDVSETDASIEVDVELPGITPDDVEVHLAGNTLTIQGAMKPREEEPGRAFHRAERRRGHFTRSVTLPCPVKDSEINAVFRDGVLTVTLPKTEEARSRKIEIHRG